MNKRIVVLIAALALFSGLAFGQSFAKDGMLVTPGSVNANIGVASSWGWGFGVVGGAEVGIGSFQIAELPFTYGAAARAGVYFYNPLYVDVGGYGTLHFCWGALDLPEELAWVSNFDTYIGLGLGVEVLPSLYFDFGWMSGVSYYFSENMAVYVESGFVGSGLGVIFKL